MKKNIAIIVLSITVICLAVSLLLHTNQPNTALVKLNKNNLLSPYKNNEQEENTKLNELAINVKNSPFNAKGDGKQDDTKAIQGAINHASEMGGGSVLLPLSTYKITSTLYVPDNIALIGLSHGKKGSIIQNEGNGFAIQTTGGHKRVNVENVRIELNGRNNGIHLGNVKSKLTNDSIPGEMGLRHITVAGIGKGKIGIKISNASHVNMVDVRAGYGAVDNPGGHGLFIYADKYNSGVIVAYDCTFGRVDASTVGLEIDGKVNLDTFNFNGCYFGGELPIRIGLNTYVRNVNFVGTHIEARDTNRKSPHTKMVELHNVLGGNFIGVSLIGFGERNNRGFVFKGDVEKVNFMGIEANGVMGAIYANEGAKLKDDSILQEARLTGRSQAVQFKGFDKFGK
ncbi:glycosyl hydrolase family 28-related protein [Priestia sp. YIM B13551]|uniref:glycosyl hydrolase family 28-related protein n=1 Tax=Priestia sp. YIM B13551 TaxID=3366306 RepID=UPI00366FE945